ncbi:tyrosine-protein phosphatase [Pantoea sp. 1.19]|uniref:tyrosine-protein phosphatase n=1 Tax=Pantoea sp. 1.19 TaxID=1925589 RepID=UPI00352B3A61
MRTSLAAQLQQGINFRDLGGLVMQDGRRIRPNCLFRSGALNELSDADLALLATLPDAAVIDYRDRRESDLHPDRLWATARYYPVAANPHGAQVSASLDTLVGEAMENFDADAFMRELYTLLPFNNPAYQQLAALLRDPHTPTIIQHCAVGKDRTGIGVALVLFALGATYDTVLQDYLLTQNALAPFRDRLLTRFHDRLNAQARAKLLVVLSVQPDCLRAALDEIIRRYATPAAWLAEEYQLDAAACARLRDRFLEG